MSNSDTSSNHKQSTPPTKDVEIAAEFVKGKVLFGTSFTALKDGLAINPEDAAAIWVPDEVPKETKCEPDSSLKDGLAVDPADVAAILMPTEGAATATITTPSQPASPTRKQRKKSQTRQPKALTGKEKQVHDMIHKDRMSQGEVAIALGCTPQNVSKLLKKAELKLSAAGSRSAKTKGQLPKDSRGQEIASTG